MSLLKLFTMVSLFENENQRDDETMIGHNLCFWSEIANAVSWGA